MNLTTEESELLNMYPGRGIIKPGNIYIKKKQIQARQGDMTKNVDGLFHV